MRKKNPQLFVPKVLHNKCDLDEFEKIFFNYWNIIPMEVYELDNYLKIIKKIRDNNLNFSEDKKIFIDLIDDLCSTIYNQKNYCEIFVEEYDGYDEKQRYVKILNVVQQLVNKPAAELEEMYASMQPILDHNYNLLCNQTYSKQIEYVK